MKRRPHSISTAGTAWARQLRTKAMRMCMEKARTSGIAMCSVRAGTHFGIASYYTMQAASEDMIGYACSNAPATMAPWGGVTPMLGTNPFSMSVPAGKHRPLVFDSASSIVARGKINLAEIEDRPIPLGWAIDQQGRPTTDATEALKGSVLPFGEHKGYGIALMIDILSGILSGAAYGPHLGPLWNNVESYQNLGFFLLAIDIASFRDIEEFKGQIDQMIDEIKASKPAPQVDEILMPGEIESRNEAYNRKHGIVVGPGVLHDLEALRREFDLDTNLAALFPFRLRFAYNCQKAWENHDHHSFKSYEISAARGKIGGRHDAGGISATVGHADIEKRRLRFCHNRHGAWRLRLRIGRQSQPVWSPYRHHAAGSRTGHAISLYRARAGCRRARHNGATVALGKGSS